MSTEQLSIFYSVIDKGMLYICYLGICISYDNYFKTLSFTALIL